MDDTWIRWVIVIWRCDFINIVWYIGLCLVRCQAITWIKDYSSWHAALVTKLGEMWLKIQVFSREWNWKCHCLTAVISFRAECANVKLRQLPDACARHRCQHWSSSPNIAISTRQQYRFNFDCGHTDLWTIRDNSHPVIFSSFNIRAYKLCVTFFFMLGLGHWEGGIAIGLNPWSLSD